MAAREPLLQARRVVASRPDENGRPQTVLKDVSLAASRGEVVAVVGPSGGGKSTLLRLFNRLLEPDSGSILLEGADIRALYPPLLRSRVTLMPQKPLLFEGTVRDNLVLADRLHRRRGGRPAGEDYGRLLDLCRIERSLLDRDGQRLSLGQQQRVCLARAMAGSCQALLLDEPTSALDWPTAEALTRTFRDLATESDLAVLLVTHDLRVARHCADRLVVLIDGRVAEAGPVEEVVASPRSEAARLFLQHPETPPEGVRQ